MNDDAQAGSAETQTSSALARIGGRFYESRGWVLLAFLVLNLWLNLTFLLPLAMGAIFAVVLHPLMLKFNRFETTKKWSDTIRASIITLGFLLLILIPIGILLFASVQAIVLKIQGFDVNALSAQNLSFNKVIDEFGLRSIVDRFYEIVPISHQQFQAYATRGLTAAAAFGANVIQNLVTSLPGIAFSNLVLLFTMFFLLIDGPKVVNFIRHNSIFNVEQTSKLINTTKLLCNSVIVATLVTGAVQSGIVALICLFVGTGNVLLITFITFLCSFFPLLGTAPVILFLAAQAFFTGHTTVGIVWLVSLIVVGSSDNVVRPYVLKGGAELHPLIGFVAAFGALDAIGFYGLFIGPIVAGLFFELIPMIARTYPRTPRVAN